MSDFGFDAYALDGVDAAGHPHPLEIARDLIATGKPRSALEVLSLHHDQLVDDPEYLLLCSEAWLATGDALRAQQALLGAARLAPQDPRPLQFLGELLAERGEHEKAERVLVKARALEAKASRAEEPLDPMAPEAEDDLIAYAERQERRHQAALNPRQVLLGATVLAAVALLITAIVLVARLPTAASPDEAASPRKAAALPPASVPIQASTEVEVKETAPPILASVPAPTGVVEVGEPVLIRDPLPEPDATPAVPLAPQPDIAEVETPEPEPPAAKPKPRPKPKATVPTTSKEPDDAVVQAELASMDPKQLTERADALYAQGHTAVAASYYRRALDIDPDYAPALVGIGQSILRAKKYSEAMMNATRALQLARGVDARPGLEAVAIYQLGRVHYERGERDAARRLFRQSISLAGTPSEAWFYLGEALSSDNSPAARHAYEKYLELVPTGHLADRARRAIQ